MSKLTLWTYDWVPEGPRGFVRDLRLRWACEEAGLAYVVRTVPFSLASRVDPRSRRPEPNRSINSKRPTGRESRKGHTDVPLDRFPARPDMMD
jgi:hypothetical protein